MRLKKHQTLGYFNIARGIGMFLILFGHSITPFFSAALPVPTLFSSAGSLLGSGIMAMFFMISGFGFYTRRPRKCWSMQTRLLLKPYLYTTTAILLTKILLAILKQRPFSKHGGSLVVTYLFGLNAEGGSTWHGIPIDSVSIFWFLLALFGSWVICNAIFRLHSRRVQGILVTGCVILSYLLTRISKIWPFCLPIVLLAVGYLAVGTVIQKRNLLEKPLPLWFWWILAGTTTVCCLFGHANIVACQWQLGLLDVAGSFCIGFLLLRLYHHLMQHNWHNRMVSVLEWVGFHSLWIVCLHGYEKVIFPWYRLQTLFPTHPIVCVWLCFLLRCGLIYLLFRLLDPISRRLRRRRHPQSPRFHSQEG